MRDRLVEFGPDTDVVLVTFTDPANIDAYLAQNDVPFTIVIDQTRSAYASFGLVRGSVAKVWGWKTIRRYIEILRSDGLDGWHRATDDTMQLGGNFIIGPDGTLVYGYWGEGPADRPSVDALIAAIPRGPS